MRSSLANKKSFIRTKKHKANLGNTHVNFETAASIDLKKRVSLGEGEVDSSQGEASTKYLRNQEVSSFLDKDLTAPDSYIITSLRPMTWRWLEKWARDNSFKE